MTVLERTDKDSIIIVCACGLTEHMIRLSRDEDFAYFDYALSPSKKLLVRIWQAIKHVLGFRSKYGDMGEVCLNTEESEAIRDYLDDWIKNVH